MRHIGQDCWVRRGRERGKREVARKKAGFNWSSAVGDGSIETSSSQSAVFHCSKLRIEFKF